MSDKINNLGHLRRSKQNTAAPKTMEKLQCTFLSYFSSLFSKITIHLRPLMQENCIYPLPALPPVAEGPGAKSKVPDRGDKVDSRIGLSRLWHYRVGHGKCVGVDSGVNTRWGYSHVWVRYIMFFFEFGLSRFWDFLIIWISNKPEGREREGHHSFQEIWRNR